MTQWEWMAILWLIMGIVNIIGGNIDRVTYALTWSMLMISFLKIIFCT